ncbi:integrase catalytic domain-containing protein [Trichonephila clavipes]|nr:integrase catalytic domain-containing protein [Trichonephila clavipes]
MDVEFVKELIQYTIEDRKKAEEDRKRAEEDRKKEAENRLREKELELARLNVRVNSDNERTGEGCNTLDALGKSVRILTVKVPNRPEGWAFFFASLERAFVSKNVPEIFKTEILLNLLGEKASNVLTYVKDDELNNYEQLKSIILREYEPSANQFLEQFKKATRHPNETFIQYTSCLITSWQYYLKLRNVSDFDNLNDLIVSDKIFSSLEKEVASHISVRAGNDWFRPLELAKEIDLYNTSRGKSLKTFLNVLTRNNPVKNASRVFLSEIKDSKCICCAESNPLYKCAVYLKLPINTKIDLIKTNNLCFNCLSTSRRAKDCKSRFVCSECQKRHHKTIHYTARNQEVTNSTFEPLNTSAPVFESRVEMHNLLTSTSINRKKCVLLSSAICYIKCENGLFPVKAILNSGYTSNFLTRSLCDLIGLKKYKTNVSVSGLIKTVIPIDSCVSVSISNKEGSYIKTLDFFLVPTITEDLVPTTKIDCNLNNIPNLKLADKNFNIPEHVQMLLGAEVFYELMLPGQFKMEGSNVIFQNTVFGFIVSGSTSSDAKGKEHCGFIQAVDNLEPSIKKFWEIENVEIDSVKPVN